MESIRTFPKQDEFKAMIEDAGFANVTYRNLTGRRCRHPFRLAHLMFSGVRHSFNLLRAGRTLAAHDALMTPEQIKQLPWLARLGLSAAQDLAPERPGKSGENAVAAALSSLGPSYIKLGQFLATRPDLVGPRRAFELKSLQDRLPPFPTDVAKRIVRDNLGKDVDAALRGLRPSGCRCLDCPGAQGGKPRWEGACREGPAAGRWQSASLPISAAIISPPASWKSSALKAGGYALSPPSTCSSSP